MTINCCETHEIHRYNDEKEYTLLATDILNAVLTDTELSAGSAKLWQFLYSKARFDTALTVQIEQRYLASCFKKHIRTIARYLNELEERGYIQSSANYSGLGSRLANTYQLSLPGAIKEKLESRPNRKQAEEGKRTPPDKIVIEAPDKTVRTNNNIKYNNTNNIIVVEFSSDDETSMSESLVFGKSLHHQVNHSESMFHVEQTSLVEKKQGQGASNLDEVEHSDKANTQVATLKNNLKKAECIINSLKDEFKVSQDLVRQRELLQDITQHESCRDRFKLDLEVLMRHIQDEHRDRSLQAKLTNNPEYILEIEGKRSFSAFELNRLKNALSRHCTKAQLPKLMNEVTYSIRFGDLELQQDTGKPLAIQHAISIALKLVREGRWQTPVGLSSFLESAVVK